VDVLVEEELGQGRYGGRAGHQAPEVDGTTEVRSAAPLAAGDMVRATVTGAEGADLVAEAAGAAVIGAPGARPARGARRVEPA
jgi:ribosomal protein S12 methylthiotransferase